MSPEQCFFAVFCVEALADELRIPGDEVYKLLTEKSDMLDGYIIPFYDSLHTQGRGWVVDDLKLQMRKEGVI